MENYTIRDPFAGHIDVEGDSIEEAVAAAYEDIPEEERPTYVWYTDERGEQREITVPGGVCRPVQ